MTEVAEKDLLLICNYLLTNQQENRIERFLVQMENVYQRIAQAPEAGSWPEELLKFGILDCREVYSHPYRVVYHYKNNTAKIILIADAHRKLGKLIKMRLSML